MNTNLTDPDRDILIAALLAMPVIEPGSSPQERIKAFQATLRELNRQGGAGKVWGEAKVGGTDFR